MNEPNATSDRAHDAAGAPSDPAAPPLALLTDIANEIGHGARVEVQTLTQGTEGDWLWGEGTKADLWNERDRQHVKTRARIITDWVEVKP